MQLSSPARSCDSCQGKADPSTAICSSGDQPGQPPPKICLGASIYRLVCVVYYLEIEPVGSRGSGTVPPPYTPVWFTNKPTSPESLPTTRHCQLCPDSGARPQTNDSINPFANDCKQCLAVVAARQNQCLGIWIQKLELF